MQKHASLKPYVAEDWLFPGDQAFRIFKEDIAPELKAQRDSGSTIYPHENNIFRAFKEVPLSEVRVVIWGQDPFFTPDSAVGLCFDNPKNHKPSPSLRRILSEIEKDTGKPSLAETNCLSYLEHLPPQGVLLLNAALTTKHGLAESHLPLWNKFTTEIIKVINKKDKVVWVLWGSFARKFKPLITNPKHIIIEGVHPSPFTKDAFLNKGFFSAVNSHLTKKITW